MGNIAFINISSLTSRAYKPILNGPSAFDRVVEWARKIPNYSGIVFISREDAEIDLSYLEPNPLQIFHREPWTEEEFINTLIEGASLTEKMEPEAFFYAWGDCPLIDAKTTETLWNLHYKYDAEYTFADGYPHGLCPEILSSKLPEKLLNLASGRNNPLRRNSLFEILRQDINAFDVETHLSPKDLRMDRVSITCDTRRNRNILEKLHTVGGTDAESLCRIIPENRLLLRNLPAYFPIQITDHCPQACSYCPFPSFAGNPLKGQTFMDLNQFIRLCDRIVEFADDAVIAPSLWGEPASHPQIGLMISQVLNRFHGKPIKILIETSGIGWERSVLEELGRNFADGRLMWIVSLDAADESLYRKLRGEGMVQAEETARLLADLFGKNCWMQAVRMNENEEDLESFYKKWKDVGGGAIIQKHDSYAAYFENRQPADLSPLDRFPCWHMKRDMPILIDGTVPVCRNDLGRRKALGNAFEESFDVIWSRGNELHKFHVRSEYPGPCAECDEYYTFNF